MPRSVVAMDRRPPLTGLRVLDLSTGIAGGYCTKLLADAGADVVKAEPPTGDPLRRHSGGEPGSPGAGALFEFLHTSRRGIVVDPATPDGRDRLLSLYRHVDVVVESFPPGTIEALGLGPDDLAAVNPAATMVSISAFGRGGPWSTRAANEFTLQALAGGTATRGLAGRDHINAGGRIGEWIGGASAALAVLAERRRAERTGCGDHVDVSLYEAMTPTCTNVQSLWGSMSGNRDASPMLEVPSIGPTKDGFVGFCIFTGQQWADFCLLIGRPELADDPDLATMGGRVQRGEPLARLVREYTQSRTTAEVADEAVALRIPVAPIGNGETIPAMEHFVARGVFVDNPGRGFLQPRVPYRLDGWPLRSFTAAPTLGEHDTDDVFPARPHDPGQRFDGADPDDQRGWPLRDVRVLDLTAFWAGPYATFALACLGADVIHVESVQRPDGMRFGSIRPPTEDQWWEWGPTFHSANAGKRSVTIDLTRPEGLAALRRLVERSDVLVENYSPRVMDQFGLTSDVLHSWNERLVVVRMPAFGLDGPWRDRVGFAQTMEQTSGMAWLTGYADSAPMNARGPCDPLAGLHAAFAALVGLAARDRDGEGPSIESTMVETALNAAAEQVIEWSANGVLLHRDANHHPGFAPQGVYPCADRPEGTMGAIAVSVDDDRQWPALVEVVGHEPWRGDRSLDQHAGRWAARHAIDEVLRAWARARPLRDAERALADAGVPAAAVVGSRWGDASPQHDARGFFEPVDHAVAGTHRIGAFPVRFARQPAARFARPAPLLGEHNGEVLGGLAGYGPDELAALAAAAVIGDRPRRA